MERKHIIRIAEYTDAVMDNFDHRELRNGDIVLVRMRIIDKHGDEGGFFCVEDSFNRDITKEPEQRILINWVDIVGRE